MGSATTTTINPGGRRRFRGGVAAVAAVALAAGVTGCGNEENSAPKVIPYQAPASSTTQPASASSNQAAPQADEAALKAANDRGKPELPKEELKEVTSLKVQDLAPGTGAEVTKDSTVVAHYTGWSVKNNGTEFDSSWGRGQPATFPLSGVIAGWTEGLQGMKAGGRRLLVIPPDKGYGAEPGSDKIAANDTLIFIVDIVGVA